MRQKCDTFWQLRANVYSTYSSIIHTSQFVYMCPVHEEVTGTLSGQCSAPHSCVVFFLFWYCSSFDSILWRVLFDQRLVFITLAKYILSISSSSHWNETRADQVLVSVGILLYSMLRLQFVYIRRRLANVFFSSSLSNLIFCRSTCRLSFSINVSTLIASGFHTTDCGHNEKKKLNWTHTQTVHMHMHGLDRPTVECNYVFKVIIFSAFSA